MAGITFNARTAMVTGSSRGIGRGIALKLADCGVKQVGIHYHKNKAAAEQTLQSLQDRGASGFLVQGDVTKPDDIKRMFDQAQDEFGSLDIFVSNARPDVEHFYQPVFEMTLQSWNVAMDSQATALLIAVREAVELMPDGGRIMRSLMRPVDRRGAGARGRQWAPPKQQWSRSAAILPTLWPLAGSR